LESAADGSAVESDPARIGNHARRKRTTNKQVEGQIKSREKSWLERLELVMCCRSRGVAGR
jgi:hypothetical protein